MSMRITISYQTKEELKTALRLLDPIIKSQSKENKKNGRYYRVYLETKLKS
ncbi:MAG: hypothetical protein ACK5JH_11260 [Anaerocolumna sp.]